MQAQKAVDMAAAMKPDPAAGGGPARAEGKGAEKPPAKPAPGAKP